MRWNFLVCAFKNHDWFDGGLDFTEDGYKFSRCHRCKNWVLTKGNF